MSPKPIQLASQEVDLTDRVGRSVTVAGSPAAAAETIVCTATAPADLRADAVILLFGFIAFTVGTNGVSARARIKQTDASGTAKADTGAVTATAANLMALSLMGVDTAPIATGQVYVITLIVASGSAVTTVSNATLIALVV